MKKLKRIIAWCCIRLFGETRWYSFLVKVGNIDPNSYYDHLAGLVMKRVLTPTSVCVDAGCHTGQVLREMVALAPNGRFLAFEPIPDLFGRLQAEFTADNIRLFQLALSDKAGTTSFNYVITNPAYSGLKKRVYGRPHEEDTQIQVQTETLDAILRSEAVPRVDYIKIDVEGAEYLVLKGAADCIKTHKPYIVFEHGKGGADCYGTTPEEVYRLLCDACGMRISLLNDWLLGKKPLTQAEFCNQYENRKNYYFMAHK